MNTENKIRELRETFNQSLDFTDVSVTREGDTLVFWNGEDRVGLEVSEDEINDLSAQYQNETWEQVSNRILRDSYHYLVLKYL